MSGVTPSDVARPPPTLTGEIEQVPPMVSAVKVGGRRLHELARQGMEVERAPATVTVYRFDDVPDPARPGVYRAEVECSSGTYVRVLAGRSRAGAGRGGAPRPSASHPDRLVRPADMRPLDAIGPEPVLSPAEAMRDLEAVTVDAAVAAPSATGCPSTGCRSVPPATAPGRCSTTPAPARRLRGDRRPTASGRPSSWPGTDGRPDYPRSRCPRRLDRYRRHHRGLRRGPPGATVPCSVTCARGPPPPGSRRWW